MGKRLGCGGGWGEAILQNANVFHQAVRSEDNYFLTVRKCAALGQAVEGLCQVQEATRLIDMILYSFTALGQAVGGMY